MDEIMEKLDLLRRTDESAFKSTLREMGIPEDIVSKFSNDTETQPSQPGGGANMENVGDLLEQFRLKGSETESDELNKLNMSGKKKPEVPGKTVTPLPGFSLKSKSLNDDKKVFINICQHEDIDVPGVKKRLNEAGEEVEGMNIPMSVGAPREELDKSSVSCRVYDIIVNPIVLNESEIDKTGQYRDFVCQLGIQCLEHKYKDVVDKRYKLPKLKYMGATVQSQYIQDRKKMPKIEEVKSEQSSKGTPKGPVSKPIEVVEKDLPFRLQYLQLESLNSPDCNNSITLQQLEKLLHEEEEKGGEDDDEQENSTLKRISIEVQPTEYTEPTIVPEQSVVAVLLSAEVSYITEEMIASATVSISPYRMLLKLDGFKKLMVYLPSAVCPLEATFSVHRPYAGFVSKGEFHLLALVDRSPWETAADYGSKVWLMSEALHRSDDKNGIEGNPYIKHIAAEDMDVSSIGDRKNENEDVLAEDKFHLNLPDNVDQYTGLKMDINILQEEVELPEDRFHRKDASSSYLIQQREQAKKDKWTNFEKEKASREKDPNVEYVDMDDFRPGGKYAEKKVGVTQAETPQPGNEEADARRKKAAKVLVESQPIIAEETAFSSTLWTELL